MSFVWKTHPAGDRAACLSSVGSSRVGFAGSDRELGWNRLVDLLDRARYVRYDFSTATRLLDVCNELMGRYGTVRHMIAHSATPAQLAETMQEFKGIGPVTAGIFLREVRPIWNVVKQEKVNHTRKRNMKRGPRRIPSTLFATTQKRRSNREVAALSKGSKKVLRKGVKGKIIPLSPSQPHSKRLGR